MTEYELIDQLYELIRVYWNSINQDIQYAIIGGTAILIALILLRRLTKKQRAYQGWTPSKSTSKKDRDSSRSQKGHVDNRGYYRTGNREHDKLVDFYQISVKY